MRRKTILAAFAGSVLPEFRLRSAAKRRERKVIDMTMEFVSPNHLFDELIDKCFEHERLGVPNILVIDSRTNRAWTFDRGSFKFVDGIRE